MIKEIHAALAEKTPYYYVLNDKNKSNWQEMTTVYRGFFCAVQSQAGNSNSGAKFKSFMTFNHV